MRMGCKVNCCNGMVFHFTAKVIQSIYLDVAETKAHVLPLSRQSWHIYVGRINDAHSL